jgi:hypothetical protein
MVKALAFGCAFVALVLGAPSGVFAQTPPEIKSLLSQLGSTKFAEREEAARQLAQDDGALPYIRQASALERNPEIRTRCSRILEQRRATACNDVLRELEAIARRGEFSRALAMASGWRFEMGEKLDMFATLAGQSLADTVEKKIQRRTTTVPEPRRDGMPKRLYLGRIQPNEWVLTRQSGNCLFAQDRVKLTGMTVASTFFVSDGMETETLGFSIAFVSGRAVLDKIWRSVLFVDGDVTLREADLSLIVSTGKVERWGRFRDCVVVAGGKIVERNDASSQNSILRPEERELREIVRPWTAAELGIEPEERDGIVRTGKVAPKSPMAQAGVLAGDMLLSLDGERTKTYDDAIRLLRQKSAEYLPFIVRVKRGDRELELVVPWLPPKAAR